MGLTGALLRAAACRPHVLIAAMPGDTAVRLGAETAVRRRGWPVAQTPADADLLLVTGAPGPSYASLLDQIWRQMPGPRVRLQADDVRAVGAVLDRGRVELAAFRERPAPHVRSADSPPHDAAGNGGMDMPGGLPMADRAPDRDGLKLDQLHVALGPVLPAWPAGLVLHVTMQGDVVQQAAVETLGTAERVSFWTEPWRDARAGRVVTVGDGARRRLAADLDSLGRFLTVAGWGEAAGTAQRLRDDALAGASATTLEPVVRRFAHRVERSRTLGWLTRDLGVLTADDAVASDVRGPALRATGDVTVRYRRWCREVRLLTAYIEDISPLTTDAVEPPRGHLDGSRALLAVLPRLLAGAELAAARLIIASLDPDLDELAEAAAVGSDH